MSKGKKNLTKKEMIGVIKELCGASSIAYMNINMYSNAEDYQVKALFDSIIEREIKSYKYDIEKKQEEIEKMKGKVKELEKYVN